MAFFAYLIEKAQIPYDDAIRWAYGQYTENFTPTWIEDISVEASSRGIVEILAGEFKLNDKGFRIKYILGEISKLYELKLFKLSNIPSILENYGFERLGFIDDKEINHAIWEIENASADYALAKEFWDEIEVNFLAQLDRCEKYGNCSYREYILITNR